MGFGRRSSGLRRGRGPELRRLDDLCRRYVMVRAGAFEVDGGGWWGRCQRCGASDALYWCHYFSRGIERVCWDVRNSWAFCSRCHYIVDEVEPRQRMGDTWFSRFVIEQVGEREHADLCALARGKSGRRVPRAEVGLRLRYLLAEQLGGRRAEG